MAVDPRMAAILEAVAAVRRAGESVAPLVGQLGLIEETLGGVHDVVVAGADQIEAQVLAPAPVVVPPVTDLDRWLVVVTGGLAPRRELVLWVAAALQAASGARPVTEAEVGDAVGMVVEYLKPAWTLLTEVTLLGAKPSGLAVERDQALVAGSEGLAFVDLSGAALQAALAWGQDILARDRASLAEPALTIGPSPWPVVV